MPSWFLMGIYFVFRSALARMARLAPYRHGTGVLPVYYSPKWCKNRGNQTVSYRRKGSLSRKDDLLIRF